MSSNFNLNNNNEESNFTYEGINSINKITNIGAWLFFLIAVAFSIILV